MSRAKAKMAIIHDKLFHFKVRILLKYFRYIFKKRIKPIVLTNHYYAIKNEYDNSYFTGKIFASDIKSACEYRNTEELKVALKYARILAIVRELSYINFSKKRGT